MRRLTKLKDWQIFIVFCSILGLLIFFAETETEFGILSSEVLRAILGVLGVIFLFSWILSMGLLLNQVSFNPYRFKKSLFIISYLVCTMQYSALHVLPLLAENNPNLPFMFSAMTPLVLLGILYIVVNITRSYKSLVADQAVGLRDYILFGLLLFFLPVGVWIIQPKINRLAKMSLHND